MRVAIVGCGYVGLELGRGLAGNGHDIWGVRRSADGASAVEAAGLVSVRADVTDPDSLGVLPDVDAVVFAASSGGRDASAARSVYVTGLENVIAEYGSRETVPDRLVYTSSTGVYGDHDGDWVDESTPIDPQTEKTRVLAAAERVALGTSTGVGIDGTVTRFSGLYGPDRYRLERYLEGPVTEGYLNMVHRDDAAGAIRHLLETNQGRGSVVLVTDDEPIAKHAFADWLADECGVDRPPKRSKAERLSDPEISDRVARRVRTSKRCTNDRLRELGYELAYPTHREGYREAIADYRSEI
ncbi:Nucleoside-diphosphate-sugar epimerase [Halopenitus malekzadehii]|uniref:Nucleoside-diphosphate-sugar epimerase n=1 Tax=Halopenitus malekzadehii TaxID=1267564 RepID=A0A1H6HRD5_9EURY|nr:SDR family oxidoreductase [Halopenitus malekzadehii]SEH37622.1 Nucleoside-diphosphate-sugar epimerase [Halopenitus malekzadehii]